MFTLQILPILQPPSMSCASTHLASPSNKIQDVRYLTPHISNVVAEDAERQKWDTILVKKN